ncbi:transposase [Gordonia sp. HY285]|uniref:transposase n=1 Tax=Gordonia liuliyuniae TaxID=2911517 RepID=UPI001F0327CB|nr:transposase [Gordonia liuliyuniae]MCF8609009.1 transposase [Gordonia liuliyuniae]
MSRTYPPEFRERALRLLAEVRPDHPSDWAAFNHVAGKVGVNPETQRNWTRAAQVDAGLRPGVPSEAQAEITRLKKQVRELERANEILQRFRSRSWW